MKGIFIVGTGRSGTHFTVRLMNGFQNAWDPMGGQENPDILGDIAKAAIHHRLPSDTTEAYYRKLLEAPEGILLDQHHPNLFFVSHWTKRLDGVVFLYPQRPAYQIVASMFRYSGVMTWYEYATGLRQRTLNRIPYPNRFLGLERYKDLETLPKHLLCAHRVFAHRRAFESAVGPARGALRGVAYESLVRDPLAEFSRVFSAAEMEQLGPFTLLETPRPESLSKYLDVLTTAQVDEIMALEDRLFPSASDG